MLSHNPQGCLKYVLLILNNASIVPFGANLSFLLIYQIKIHLGHLQSTFEILVLFPINRNYKYQLVNQPTHLQGRSSIRFDFGHFGNHNLR